jgi:putative acetyltransferase
MKIRRARDEDYAAMARLRRQTIRHVNTRDYSQEVIHSWSAKGGAQTLRASAAECRRWVALDRDRIVGFAEHRLTCELSRIYVHKDHLRKGIGSRLLAVAEVSLARQGCKEVRVESTATAKDFYRKNGYNLMAKDAHENGGLVYRMLKALGSA